MISVKKNVLYLDQKVTEIIRMSRDTHRSYKTKFKNVSGGFLELGHGGATTSLPATDSGRLIWRLRLRQQTALLIQPHRRRCPSQRIEERRTTVRSLSGDTAWQRRLTTCFLAAASLSSGTIAFKAGAMRRKPWRHGRRATSTSRRSSSSWRINDDATQKTKRLGWVVVGVDGKGG